MVSPGLRVPSRSASSIIRRLIRSFTLPPALKNSHFATSNTSQTEGFNVWVANRSKNASRKLERKHTYFTFESKGFGDLVDAHHRSVPDLVQDVWKNGRRAGSKNRSWAKDDYLFLLIHVIISVLHVARAQIKPESRALLWSLEVRGINF